MEQNEEDFELHITNGCFFFVLQLLMETDLKSAKAKISPEFFRKVLSAELEAVCSGLQWNGILL